MADDDGSGVTGGGWAAPGVACLSDDELTVGYDEAVAAVRRAQWRRLQVAAEVERRRMWRTDGVRSLRDWVCTRNGEGDRAAFRESLMARGLESRPLLGAALAEGRVSVEHVRCLLVLAGLAGLSDEELVGLGEAHTVLQLETACRSARRLSRAEDRDAQDRRFVRWWCEDDGTLHVRGRLPAEGGAIVTTMLSAMAEDAEADPETGLYDPFDARCADALVDRCRGPEGTATERPTVVIHAPLAALAGDGWSDGPGDPAAPGAPAAPGGGLAGWVVAMTWDGTVIGSDGLRRLLCDTRVRATLDDAEGRAVGIGRRSRTIPGWLLGQLRWRDRGCRFPGCERTRWLHGHHLVHWADGGATDLANLVQLCGHHHRSVHEGGWSVSGSPDAELTFTGPGGRRFTTRPAVVLGAARTCPSGPPGRARRRRPAGTARPRGPVAPGAP